MANGSYGGAPEEWTTEAFLDHFLRIHWQMPERRFAFVLGAGASVTSGIPAGGQLVDGWLDELKLRDPNSKDQSVEHWAKNGLGMDDFEFKRRAEFYPEIYERRFGDDLEEGYAYLEEVMKGAQPGLVYCFIKIYPFKTRPLTARTSSSGEPPARR